MVKVAKECKDVTSNSKQYNAKLLYIAWDSENGEPYHLGNGFFLNANQMGRNKYLRNGMLKCYYVAL